MRKVTQIWSPEDAAKLQEDMARHPAIAAHLGPVAENPTAEVIDLASRRRTDA